MPPDVEGRRTIDPFPDTALQTHFNMLSGGVHAVAFNGRGVGRRGGVHVTVPPVMIRFCTQEDFEEIFAVVNDGAQAYKGVIPGDRWRDPYMPRDILGAEIAAGVKFWGFEGDNRLLGVMGLQPVQDVVLIRHAYVRSAMRRRGIGSRLLEHIRSFTEGPLLVGTWAAANWAIRFYDKHGFHLVPRDEAPALLRRYWDIPDRQVETSVVLADLAWRARRDTQGTVTQA